MSSNEEISEMEVATSFAKFCHDLLQSSGEELNAKALVETDRRKIHEPGFKRKSAIARTEFMAAIEEFYFTQ